MTQKILVAEDDVRTAELLRLYLEREGYQVLISHDGRQALELARQRRPDLLVLDLMLPSVDGLDICRILRAESTLPIIMLTARSTEDDMLLGLDLGADDYVNKPFSPRALVARVRAVLRRSAEATSAPDEAQHGALRVDFRRHEAWLGQQPLHLTPKEFKLLETLIREPGRAFARSDLLERVFGFDYEGLDRTVDVHIMNLRRKIEQDAAQPRYILTVYGMGYKFNGEHDAL